MSFIKVCKESELEEGQIKAFHTKEGALVVVKAEGKLYAFQENCTHADVSLAEGSIDGDLIVCNAHQASFHLEDGSVEDMPATEDLETYPVRVVDGDVEVDLS